MKTGRRALLGMLLGSLAVLALIGVVGMLRPDAEARENVDVPFDTEGPMAQPFKLESLEGWVVRLPDGSFRAYSAADPRLGCRIEFIPPGHPLYRPRNDLPGYEYGYFTDRCMHSQYTYDGMRFFGPTPRGLDEFTVRDVTGGRVFLDLTRVKRGLCGEGAVSSGHCSSPDQPRYAAPAVVDEGYTSRFPWPLY